MIFTVHMETACDLRPRILIADDQPSILESLKLLLSAAGFDLDTAHAGDDLIDLLQRRRYDLVLMDLNFSSGATTGDEGLGLLTRISAIDEYLPVVVMTGWSTVELAVATLRAHASDFVQKPWDNQALISLAHREIEKGRSRRRRRCAEMREFEEARALQARLLPTELPSIPGCELAAEWRSARGVTGDYFDAIRLDERRMAICIGDVAGKGLPAALLMSTVQAAVRTLAPACGRPQELCAQLNRLVCGATLTDRFVTFFYGIVDTRARTFTYTNAGHNAPFAIRRDGSLARLGEGGLPLGIFADLSYVQAVTPLASGDRIILFTDGITEARTPSGDEFGEDGLAASLNECASLTARELKDRVIDVVTRSCGEDFRDDVTLMIVAAQ